MQIKYHPAFWPEVEEILNYCWNEYGPSEALSLIMDVNHTLKRISENPERFSRIPGTNIRRLRCHLHRWYSVRYQIQEDAIVVGQLFHGARHPDTGKDRFR